MQDSRPGSARLLLGLLIFLNVLNYVDRQSLAAFMVDIRRDIGLSYFQFTLLVGLVFSLFYAIAGMPAGMLADRMHRPRLIAGAVTLWSALTAATGVAGSFAQIAAVRAFAAVGEATLTPTSVSLLADRYPPERQGIAISMFYLGLPLGAGGSFLVAGLLGPVLGWRGCFYLLGAIGLVAALALLPLRDAARAGVQRPAPAIATAKEAFRSITARPALGLLILAAVLLFFSQGAVVIDQEWLVRERGFTVRQAQVIFGLLFIASGVIGTAISGRLSDAAGRSGVPGRLRYLAGIAVLCVIVSIAYRLSPAGSPLFYALAFVGGMLFIAPFGTVMASISELALPASRATTVAIGIMLMTVFGTAGGNAVTGWIADRLTAQHAGSPLTGAVLLVNAVAALASVLFLIAARVARSPSRVQS